MTAQKKLKASVHARIDQTGESFIVHAATFSTGLRRTSTYSGAGSVRIRRPWPVCRAKRALSSWWCRLRRRPERLGNVTASGSTPIRRRFR